MEKVNQEDFPWIPIHKAKKEKSRENEENKESIYKRERKNDRRREKRKVLEMCRKKK